MNSTPRDLDDPAPARHIEHHWCPECRCWVRLDTGTTDPWRPRVWFGVDVARDETHFALTPLQREFIERTRLGERVIVVPGRRSSGWPEVFRIVEGLAKEARAPWRADAAAAENGMGC